MTTTCKKCNLGKHASKSCPITTRKMKRWTRRVGQHVGKKDFWDGVFTRNQLAGQMKNHKKIKKELAEKKEELQKIKDNSDICVICQEQCLEKSENSTPCGHVFHTGCLLGWLKNNNTCPCCRASLYDKPVEPNLEDVRGVVDTAIRTHLELSPEQEGQVTVDIDILHMIGDDIGRLVSEELLNIDLMWPVDLEEIDTDTEDSDIDDNDDTATVVTEDLDTNVEGLDAEDIAALLDEPTVTFEEALNEGYWDENQEEKMPEQSPILTPETPETPDLFVEFHFREPQSMMEQETTQFTEWFRFGGVLQELRSRSSFMRAWNNIEAEHRNRTNSPTVIVGESISI